MDIFYSFIVERAPFVYVIVHLYIIQQAPQPILALLAVGRVVENLSVLDFVV